MHPAFALLPIRQFYPPGTHSKIRALAAVLAVPKRVVTSTYPSEGAAKHHHASGLLLQHAAATPASTAAQQAPAVTHAGDASQPALMGSAAFATSCQVPLKAAAAPVVQQPMPQQRTHAELQTADAAGLQNGAPPPLPMPPLLGPEPSLIGPLGGAVGAASLASVAPVSVLPVSEELWQLLHQRAPAAAAPAQAAALHAAAGGALQQQPPIFVLQLPQLQLPLPQNVHLSQQSVASGGQPQHVVQLPGTHSMPPTPAAALQLLSPHVQAAVSAPPLMNAIERLRRISSGHSPRHSPHPGRAAAAQQAGGSGGAGCQQLQKGSPATPRTPRR